MPSALGIAVTADLTCNTDDIPLGVGIQTAIGMSNYKITNVPDL